MNPSLALPQVLPVNRPTANPTALDRGAPAPASALVGKRAVIAEDQGLTQLQLAKILKSAGVVVVGVAGNGRQAVEIVRATHPDLVLMDIRMPVMDGLAATREIMAEKPVCVVMLTAFSEDEYRREAQDLGACGYILKPVTSDSLLPELTQALRQFASR